MLSVTMVSWFVPVSFVLAAWLLTYLLHSTVLLGGAWAVGRRLPERRAAAKDAMWKIALLAPFLTATLQLVAADYEPAGGRLRVPASALIAQQPLVVREAPVLRIPHRTPSAGGVELRTSPSSASPVVAQAPKRANKSEHARPAVTPALRRMVVPAAMAAWLLVALALAARVLVRHLRFQGLVSSCAPLACVRTTGALARLARTAGFAERMSLVTSSRIPVPVAFGRGVICVPERSLDDLDETQLTGLLAHELAHLVRRDPTWLSICGAVEAVCFFQPLNRIARRELQANAEFLCDDMAARLMGDGLPLAKCLATVATWVDRGPAPAFTSAIVGSRSPLVKRVERLLDDRARPLPSLKRRHHVVIASCVIVLVALAAPAFTFTSSPVKHKGVVGEKALAPQVLVVPQRPAGERTLTSWEREHRSVRAFSTDAPHEVVDPVACPEAPSCKTGDVAAFVPPVLAISTDSPKPTVTAVDAKHPAIVVGDEVAITRAGEDVSVRIGNRVVPDAQVRVEGGDVLVLDPDGQVILRSPFDDWAVSDDGEWHATRPIVLNTTNLEALQKYAELQELTQRAIESAAEQLSRQEPRKQIERALEALESSRSHIRSVAGDDGIRVYEEAKAQYEKAMAGGDDEEWDGANDDGEDNWYASSNGNDDDESYSSSEDDADDDLDTDDDGGRSYSYSYSYSGKGLDIDGSGWAGAERWSKTLVRDLDREDRTRVRKLIRAAQEGTLDDLGRELDEAQIAKGSPARKTAAEVMALVAISDDDDDLLAQALDAGADPKMADEDGHTVLHAAVARGSSAAVERLLERGADAKAQDEEQRTPLHLAAGTGDASIVEALLHAGARPDVADDNGRTPLYFGVSSGDQDVVKVLLDAGAVVRVQDNLELSPLHLAVSESNYDIAALLLERGADANAEDEGGRTPLHVAVQESDLDMASLLIEHGANPRAEDESGYSPLDLARHEDDEDMVALFRGSREERASTGKEHESKRK